MRCSSLIVKVLTLKHLSSCGLSFFNIVPWSGPALKFPWWPASWTQGYLCFLYVWKNGVHCTMFRSFLHLSDCWNEEKKIGCLLFKFHFFNYPFFRLPQYIREWILVLTFYVYRFILTFNNQCLIFVIQLLSNLFECEWVTPSITILFYYSCLFYLKIDKIGRYVLSTTYIYIFISNFF